ncbi:MAG TPA: type II secretion system protein [Tepidisphaeraceae bacterium]|nr:type II secretion system protein [Tepidisphaeraceae bacterium]
MFPKRFNPPDPRRRGGRRPGFTLVELLTSIGIIAVLVALLFPLIAKARAAAREAVCQSNLRQLMVAFQAFAHDHDDQLPGGFWDLKAKTDPNPDHWDWLRGNATQWSSAPAGGTLFNYVGRTFGVYRCPGSELNARAASTSIGPGFGSNGLYDYVSMLDFTGARLSNVHPSSQLTYPDGHVETLPTPIILEGDPKLLNGLMQSWHAGADSMARNHRGGAYYASIDGSVQWINEPPGGCSMWQSQSATGRWRSLGNYPMYWNQWNRQ